MRRNLLILGAFFVVAAPFIVFAALVPCGTSYNPTPCSICDLFALGQILVKFLTETIAPALAVLAFAWAGFKILISGGSPGQRQEGIKIIRNTIIGLLIVFGAWIIINELLLFFAGTLYTNSTRGGLKMPWDKITCIAPVTGVQVTPPPTLAAGERLCASNNQKITVAQQTGYSASQTSNYSKITIANILISGASGSCATIDTAVPSPDGSKATCTSVAYLPQFAIDKLIAISKKMANPKANPPDIVITGGTECGHQTHGFDKSVVDLRDTSGLSTYLMSNPYTQGTTSKGCITYTKDGTTYVLENSVCAGTATHFHVQL